MIAQNYRLRRWRVEKILKKGSEAKIGSFIIKYGLNKCGFYRFSVVMSRKFEKTAVSRNKKKRQVYEAIRNNIKEKPKDEAEKRYYDIILIPYKKILTCNYSKIYQNISDILKYFNKIL
ncbi:ribonuclease P protein component [Candidatus Peregrinibacteria bacterium]|nr:ribonuclease P protein component [Candidatus Peregrinibacteria bacterium]